MVQSKNQVKDAAGNILDAIFCIVKKNIPNGGLGSTSHIYIQTIFVEGVVSTSRHMNTFKMANGSTYEIW